MESALAFTAGTQSLANFGASKTVGLPSNIAVKTAPFGRWDGVKARRPLH
jgi:hypothetical protein